MQHRGSQVMPKPPQEINCLLLSQQHQHPTTQRTNPALLSPPPVLMDITDCEEQLAQGVPNLGFILKTSCGCEQSSSLTPVVHSVFSCPAETNHNMACFKEKTVTHKQLFILELNMQE